MIAWLNLRLTVTERRAAFVAGLQALGYKVREELTLRPGPRDILVTWNRIAEGHTAANAFEHEQCRVIVAENATWGNEFAGERWYFVGDRYHNKASAVRYAGPERWDRLGVELDPWRADGQTVLLPQRGIGPPSVAMPRDWLSYTRKRFPTARVRHHPGRGIESPLRWDLEHASRVVTWGSGAAVKACMWGCEVVSDMPDWIGSHQPLDESRLSMLRHLAWGQWTFKEIENGTAFAHILNR